MDKYPLVSVIIPTYNRKRYVIEAIDSVLIQTYKNIEIIVIDDGSTDGTKEALASYMNRIKYCFQQNKSVALARNQGIKLSNSQYIAFLDSDDRWLPGKIEKQIVLFSKNQNVGLVYSDYYRFDNSGRQPQTTFEWKKAYRGKVLPQLLRSYFVRTSTVIVKKCYIEKVGLFCKGLTPSEDYDMWVRLSEVCEFDYINEPLVEFRINKEGISKRDIVRSSLCHLAVLKKYRLHSSNHSNDLDIIVNGEILKYYFQAAKLAYNAKQYRLALECIYKSMNVNSELPIRVLLLVKVLFKILYISKNRLDKTNLLDYSSIEYLLS